jgi:hypothetical protein
MCIKYLVRSAEVRDMQTVSSLLKHIEVSVESAGYRLVPPAFLPRFHFLQLPDHRQP